MDLVAVKPVFLKVCDGPEILRRIHRYQQRNVARLLAGAPTLTSVERIVVFGSSVTYKCHCHSDLDIAVKWLYFDGMEQNSLRMSVRESDVDMLNIEEDSEYRIQREIRDKGVIVYDINIPDINNPKKILHDVTGGAYKYV